MIIKMLLEEAGQFFYCEARKAAPHCFEGIAHFLHKVGDGNAFVRGKSYTASGKFESRTDALTAAECFGKHIANQRDQTAADAPKQSNYCTPLQGRTTGAQPVEKTAR